MKNPLTSENRVLWVNTSLVKSYSFSKLYKYEFNNFFYYLWFFTDFNNIIMIKYKLWWLLWWYPEFCGNGSHCKLRRIADVSCNPNISKYFCARHSSQLTRVWWCLFLSVWCQKSFCASISLSCVWTWQAAARCKPSISYSLFMTPWDNAATFISNYPCI